MLSVHIAVAKSADWWDSLTVQQQKAYIKKHPRSKHAKEAKPSTEVPAKKKFELKVPKAQFSKFTAEQKEFFATGQHLPNSVERRKLGALMRDKAKGIVKGLKHEVKEWKTAGNAVKKIAQGKALDTHDKSALKAVAIHTGLVVGTMALTGGLSGGASAIAKGMGLHMLEHSALVRTAQGMVFAANNSIDNKTSAERALEIMIEHMADAATTASFSDSVWATAAVEHAEEK